MEDSYNVVYVKRFIVWKSWKKYELKCRLHNEVGKPLKNYYSETKPHGIDIGFKIYTGTVWADDAHYEEVGNSLFT